MNKKYIVELTLKERNSLEDVIKKNNAAAHKKRKARMLMKMDQGEFGPAWSDEKTAEAFDCQIITCQRLRKKLVEHGFENVLEHKNRKNDYARKISGREEAHLIALACSEPPEGRNRWTLRLLAEKMVELKFADACCKSTVSNVLKKTNLSLT